MSAPLLRVIAHRRDPASEPERWGYIDRTGRLMIEPRFDDARDFHDGRARVVLDGQPTFIDETGTPVMRSRYQQLGDFAEGRASVGAYGKHGYVDRAGEL